MPRSTQSGNIEIEHVLVEQRVRQRDEKEVELEALEQAGDHRRQVDSGADRPDNARGLELGERLPATPAELVETGRHAGVVPVVETVEVMDQKQIDTLEPQPLQAVLERAPHAGVAVVEIVLERETAAPRLPHRIPGVARGS